METSLLCGCLQFNILSFPIPFRKATFVRLEIFKPFFLGLETLQLRRASCRRKGEAPGAAGARSETLGEAALLRSFISCLDMPRMTQGYSPPWLKIRKECPPARAAARFASTSSKHEMTQRGRLTQHPGQRPTCREPPAGCLPRARWT